MKKFTLLPSGFCDRMFEHRTKLGVNLPNAAYQVGIAPEYYWKAENYGMMSPRTKQLIEDWLSKSDRLPANGATNSNNMKGEGVKVPDLHGPFT
jgi:hypothetical protein